MLDILYNSARYVYGLSRLSDIKGGMLATFTGTNREVEVCNDKKIPVGFFTEDFSLLDRNTAVPPRVIIAVGQGEYGTTIFEKSTYKCDDFLYCSCNGKITNEIKYKGEIIVGIVNYVTEERIGFITCFARGLEK